MAIDVTDINQKNANVLIGSDIVIDCYSTIPKSGNVGTSITINIMDNALFTKNSDSCKKELQTYLESVFEEVPTNGV